MSCSPSDLKDYFFGELSEAQRSAMEAHVAGCIGCREELTALSGVRAALLSVPDEEPPRRIAFVSDKVFEPGWWQRLWSSGPRLGFASAALLALALVIHGFAARPVTQTAAVEREIESRVRAEVARVVADREGKQMAKVLQVVETKLQNSTQKDNYDLVVIREYLERMNKREAIMTRRVNYE